MSNAHINFRQIEEWIVQSNTPGNAQQQWNATKLLQEWSDSDENVVKSTLFQLLTSGTSRDDVRFFALTTLARVETTVDERTELRRYLLLHFADRAPFLRNKAAVILKQHILLDAGGAWSDMERDLIQLAQSNPLLFCKTIETLLEDFVSDDVQAAERVRTRKVKDLLKGNINPVKKNDSTLLVKLFSTTATVLSGTTQDQEIRLAAVNTIRYFFNWTEPTFLGPDTVTFVLENLLHALTNNREAALQEASLKAWQDFATCSSTKSTGVSSISNNNDPKIPIFSTLLEKLHALNLLPYSGESEAEIEVVIQVAELIATIGLEMTSIWNDTSNEKVQIITNQVLDLFFRAFAYDDIDVSLVVIPLASKLITMMEPGSHDGSPCLRSHVPRLLNTLYNQIKYPENFSYEFKEDVDAEEEQYRTAMGKLYTKMVRVNPEVCLQFILEMMGQWLGSNQDFAKISHASTPDLEAGLRLVYRYCEGIRPAPGLKVVMRDEKFCSFLVVLHQSSIAQHTHREVLCWYFDVTARYYPIFLQAEHSSLLANVFQAMTGAQGLQNPHSKVRSRCCYFLLRLVKSVIRVLRPYVETAVTGILGLLSSSSFQVETDDAAYLFETIGLLLGKTGLSEDDQCRYLTNIMTPHVQNIESTLQLPSLRQDSETHGPSLAGAIVSLTNLSKGFARPGESIQAILFQTLQVSLTVLEALPEEDLIRSKTVVHLQRMIVCIGERTLALFPQFCQILIQHCTADDILFVSQILNQVCTKFKGNSSRVIDGCLLPFLQKCHTIATSQEEDATELGADLPPHLYTEQLAIRKLSYSVVQFIVTNGATSVLLSPTNVGSLEAILRLMCNGAITSVDPTIRRTCLRFFRDWLAQWQDAAQPNNDTYRRGFVQFCGETLIPNVSTVLRQPLFDEQDAMEARVVSEFAGILTLWSKQTEDATLVLALRTLSGSTLDATSARKALESDKSANQWLQYVLSTCKSR